MVLWCMLAFEPSSFNSLMYIIEILQRLIQSEILGSLWKLQNAKFNDSDDGKNRNKEQTSRQQKNAD